MTPDMKPLFEAFTNNRSLRTLFKQTANREKQNQQTRSVEGLKDSTDYKGTPAMINRVLGRKVLAGALSLALTPLALTAAFAQSTGDTAGTNNSVLPVTSDIDDKEHERERKEVETTLANIEALWNAHNLDGVMANYADDYINNDGLDRKAVSKLTQDFWKTYPDAHSSSKTKQIRITGNYATVDSRDQATGTTAAEMKTMNSKGELWSVSDSQLYFKKIGANWKIIGDRVNYESVKVAFGLARQLATEFSAPEQVKSGRQYSARLEVNLPPGTFAVGSITNQPLRYPQPTPTDTPRPLESPAILERVMNANTENRNELLTATVILTDPPRTQVKGVTFLTRRLNVVPEQLEIKDETEVAEEKSDKSQKDAQVEKADKSDKADHEAKGEVKQNKDGAAADTASTAKESAAKETSAKESAKETAKESAKDSAKDSAKEMAKETSKSSKGDAKAAVKEAHSKSAIKAKHKVVAKEPDKSKESDKAKEADKTADKSKEAAKSKESDKSKEPAKKTDKTEKGK